ncbi:hypothetical protein NKG05_28045 [Oerskovia sp. M15]
MTPADDEVPVPTDDTPAPEAEEPRPEQESTTSEVEELVVVPVEPAAGADQVDGRPAPSTTRRPSTTRSPSARPRRPSRSWGDASVRSSGGRRSRGGARRGPARPRRRPRTRPTPGPGVTSSGRPRGAGRRGLDDARSPRCVRTDAREALTDQGRRSLRDERVGEAGKAMRPRSPVPRCLPDSSAPCWASRSPSR